MNDGAMPHLLLFKLDMARPGKDGLPVACGSIQCAFAFEPEPGSVRWEATLRAQSGFGAAFASLCRRLLESELGIAPAARLDWRDALLSRPSVEVLGWRGSRGAAALRAQAIMPCRIGADRAQAIAELLRRASGGALAARLGACSWSAADIGSGGEIGRAFGPAWDGLAAGGADALACLDALLAQAAESSAERALLGTPPAAKA